MSINDESKAVERPRRSWRDVDLRAVAPFAALLLLLIVGALVNPNFIGITNLANVATRAGVEGAGVRVHAPLMRMGKDEIVREGLRLGVDFAATVSCYRADTEGRACRECDACFLRAEGFRAAGIEDPTRYRS